ncbi:uncharacterized protein LOC114769244 isoform X4 [Denticeps clupeoides]|uniref:uncharacterized protein LOC114769244 isoform X4 n=1 Tax=Denticeps clupeoides TaxID=299321 RepID=UPI0010A2EBC8|nr:uncharacterized protein LOC114769244 isoform X4 [Denticeps clupeoides]
MQLVFLCREKDFKEFGHNKVFSELLADLRVLEEKGITIVDKSVVKGALYCIAGDNLGSHCIGGFTENFSSSEYLCRYCLLTRTEFQGADPAICGPQRTPETYRSATEQLETENVSEVQGIKFSYYCFNIHYPVELRSTLEFLQRCFFSINPERGTKVECKKKLWSVNPRVLTLISDIADHEWT